jgi:hypothetical protein
MLNRRRKRPEEVEPGSTLHLRHRGRELIQTTSRVAVVGQDRRESGELGSPSRNDHLIKLAGDGDAVDSDALHLGTENRAREQDDEIGGGGQSADGFLQQTPFSRIQ